MAMSRLEMCEEALNQIEDYARRFPDELALTSVANQLRYLIAVERGQEADRSRLTELTLGRFAVYELSNIISDDLSKLLCGISDSVRRQIRAEGASK